jgi:hypothetical protein
MQRLLLLLTLALLLGACESKDGLADSVTGSGVEVHCAAQTKALGSSVRPGIGDTDVRVVCPPVPE